MHYNVEQKLAEWGKWSRYQGVKGYPMQTPERSQLGGGIACAGISDDEALFIDSIVSMLKDQSQKQAMRQYYATGMNMAKTSRDMGVKYPIMNSLIERGTAFVEGALCMAEARL